MIASIILILLLGCFIFVYLGLYGYGVVLAAKAHPAWVVACLCFGPIPVTVAIVYFLTGKNLFLLSFKRGK